MKLIKQKILNEYFNNLEKNNNNLVVDIDGVIASLVPDGNYNEAKPIMDNINYLNSLKKAGIKITLYTARGSNSGKNWKNLTVKQMKEWGVMYEPVATTFYEKLNNLEVLEFGFRFHPMSCRIACVQHDLRLPQTNPWPQR